MTNIIKVIFTDSGQDKAIKGILVDENENFISISANNRTYTINKSRVVCIEKLRGGQDECGDQNY